MIVYKTPKVWLTGRNFLRWKVSYKMVRHHEGKISNHPKDSGKLTIAGISQRWHPKAKVFKLYTGNRRITPEMEIAITEFYFAKYMRMNSKKIVSIEIAARHFSLAVNTGMQDGPKRATYVIQDALRANHKFVVRDGRLGQRTLSAINTTRALSLIPAFRSETAGFYRLLACKKPSQKVFLRGWEIRAYY